MDMNIEHEQEARQALTNRVATAKAYLENYQDGLGDDDPEYGDIYDYGLDFAKVITDHRAGTVTYCHLLSTGGPQEEMLVTIDDDRPNREYRVTFVYKPWFGNVTITDEQMSDEDQRVLVDFYGAFFDEDMTTEGI